MACCVVALNVSMRTKLLLTARCFTTLLQLGQRLPGRRLCHCHGHGGAHQLVAMAAWWRSYCTLHIYFVSVVNIREPSALQGSNCVVVHLHVS